MRYVYILALRFNKYYIGKTTNPNFRLEQHFKSNGSTWTKKYKPIKIVEIIPNCDNFDEDKYTLKYMKDYGIENVRGGSFCEVTLNVNHIFTIQKMIDSSSNKCYICGQDGHFANECIYSKKNIEKIIEKKPILFQENDIESPTKKCKRSIICFKCGCEGHYSNICPNK